LEAQAISFCLSAVKEIELPSTRKAILLQVPFRLFHTFRQRASCSLLRMAKELERKFTGTDVLFVANYRILPKPKSGSLSRRARSRTLTSVHEAILSDIVYPTEIVGKRIRYRSDGSKILKVYLEPKERYCTEHKLETFSAVYERLTGKNVVFLYPLT
jgi:small subunit ribosomal protein S7e